jgi:hypothetical protein|tara:strand:+ start:149 stop:580 length:432 start_codon:yes stop_codon:yes gene_type:complete
MISILGSLVSLGSTFLQGKQDEAKAKAEAAIVGIQADADIKRAKALAATKMAESGQAQNYDLDRLAMEQMGKSWKDEVILIIFLAPMVMAFIPGMDGYALAGFTVIAKMPEWYQYIIIGMVVVIYGMRGMLEKILDKKLGAPK